MDEKSTEIGEIKSIIIGKQREEKHESKQKEETVLLLCLTPILQPVWLRRPY